MTEIRNFRQDLRETETTEVDAKVRKALKKHFPACETIIKNDVKGNDGGVDYYVSNFIYEYKIDVKVRKRSSKDGDVALELWSNKEVGKVGWTLDSSKKTDYIVWIWDDGHSEIFYFKDILEVFEERKDIWEKEFFAPTQKTGSGGTYYTSQCVFVPISTLKEAIYWIQEFKNLKNTIL